MEPNEVSLGLWWYVNIVITSLKVAINIWELIGTPAYIKFEVMKPALYVSNYLLDIMFL